jgi:ribonuclease E
MSKKMLVNATHPEENRVAIVEDGVLTELDIEVAGREPSKGNIYKAVVVRVESGLQAAFVDYGAERLGFLQIDEINFKTVKPNLQIEENRRPRINDLLQRGQEVLVQIIKEERGTKGAALTTYLSLAGRYMVLMPGSQTRGVSRRAESDSQRKELKKAMSSIDLAEGVGYIVRTAALDQSREELERDYRYLIRLFESIRDLGQKVKAPALIYKESNLMIRSIRDYFTTDMDEVLIDDPQVFKEAKDFFQMVMPDHVNLVKLHQERRPIFSRYQIEDQIETLSRNKVTLPSGGSIVIDPTEALVSIDVNSGKLASEQGVEATATKTNLEAAEEVGRQLRLRDLGGLIVIDFIDMRERKHMRQVENQLKKALENDKARVNVGRISQFGLLEMSRQRIKAALTEGSYLTCPHCNGSGHLKSPETQAVALLRKIHASAAKGQVSRVDAQLPMDVAAYLLNNKREELVEMERRYQLQIHIHGNRDFLADQIEIEIQKKEKEKVSEPEYIAAGKIPQVAEEPPAPPPVQEPKDAAEAAETPQQEGAETEADPTKKRRRRRRRKPAAAADAAETAATDSGTEEPTPDTAPDLPVAVDTPAKSEEATPLPEAAAAAEQPLAASPDTQADPQGTAKPKRRRSRRKPKAPTSAPLTETPTPESEPAQAASTILPVDQPASASERAEPAFTAAAPPTVDQVSHPEKTTVDSPSESSEAQGEVPAKPKRRRSRRKPKPAGSAPSAEATAPATEPAQPQAPAMPATGEVTAEPGEAGQAVQAKPKRRPRRPVAKPGSTPQATEASPEKPAQPPAVGEQQKPEKPAKSEGPPKRRRTGRASSKPKASEHKAPESSGSAEQAVRITPTTRTSPTPGGPVAGEPAPKPAATETKTDPTATGANSGQEKPKPRGRRPARKKPVKTDPVSQG